MTRGAPFVRCCNGVNCRHLAVPPPLAVGDVFFSYIIKFQIRRCVGVWLYGIFLIHRRGQWPLVVYYVTEPQVPYPLPVTWLLVSKKYLGLVTIYPAVGVTLATRELSIYIINADCRNKHWPADSYFHYLSHDNKRLEWGRNGRGQAARQAGGQSGVGWRDWWSNFEQPMSLQRAFTPSTFLRHRNWVRVWIEAQPK